MDLRADHMRRMRLWRAMDPQIDIVDNMVREVALTVAADQIGPKEKARPMGTNTGAKGFASTLKALAAQMREEFSKLHEEINGEFTVMKGHLEAGKAAVVEMKSDNAELREALGLGNSEQK